MADTGGKDYIETRVEREEDSDSDSSSQSQVSQPDEDNDHDDVPQPPNVTQQQIEDLSALLETLRQDRYKPFFYSNTCRPLRKALQPWVRELGSRMYGGKSKEKYDAKIRKEKGRKAVLTRMKDLDKRYINSVALRQKRMGKLNKLLTQTGAQNFPLIADGAADTENSQPSLSPLPDPQTQRETKNPTVTRASSTVTRDPVAVTRVYKKPERKAEEGRVIDEKAVDDGGAGVGVDGGGLHYPRSCYICKIRYRVLHHFYDQLCPQCASLNWEKRFQSGDLRGRVGLVTGGRVKIGFHVALKLLRAGCHTIVTSRFPKDAAVRFAKQTDFDEWKSRLDIYGIDFRNIKGVEIFCAFLVATYSRLDVLINNACQTIRRPALYYAPLLKTEHLPLNSLPVGIEDVLSKQDRLSKSIRISQKLLPTITPTSKTANPVEETKGRDQKTELVNNNSGPIESGENRDDIIGVGSKAGLMTQLPVMTYDKHLDTKKMPTGVVDVNGQQVDLRRSNSWLLKIHEVQSGELAEVFAINAMAPFIINSKLLELMKKAPYPPEKSPKSSSEDDTRVRRFIINVSAMEGKFYRHKLPTHPHTNMAKAALNMMTRTCSGELYSNENVLMNSVDTGWINDENPLHKAAAYAKSANFQTPIDEIDAAARILDPVFACLGPDTPPIFGKFLKDFHPTEW
ncbi:hypothetical protein AAMO2058_001589300 [Amorphochlora amoebiformis]